MMFRYLTEGAANVIWATDIRDPTQGECDGQLVLRLRKNLAFTTSSKQAVQEFETRIAPLFQFDTTLLQKPTLFELDAEIVEALNDKLRQAENEGKRSIKRQNIYHCPYIEEPQGILIGNLLANQNATHVEFKPKWLQQSPSAPENAIRCRTCALNAMRKSKGTIRGRGDSGFCPFDLLSSHESVVRAALSNVWPEKSTLDAFCVDFKMKVQPTLKHLQRLQREYNEVGLHEFEDPSEKDFSVAMALRDCSVFLEVTLNAQSSTINIGMVKLLDLDLKDAGGGKLQKWIDMEEELISKRWYSKHVEGSAPCSMTDPLK